MGDFNISPNDELLKPICRRMTDTGAFLSDEGYTWPSDRPEMKIDYLFISRDLQVNQAEVLPIIASDHRPYFANVTI